LLKRLTAPAKQAPRAILITLGSRGAALATRDGLWLAGPPRVAASKIVSPTGCGDAATAGWLWAMADGVGPEEALSRAVACGTAKLLNADPGVVDPHSVRRFCAMACTD
jgi:fructose-1-phosphate kinase PfkB-like protein